VTPCRPAEPLTDCYVQLLLLGALALRESSLATGKTLM